MLDNTVVWHEFCRSSVDKQNVDKASWQKKCASSSTSSSPIKSRRFITLMSSTTSEKLVNRTWWHMFLCMQGTTEKVTKASILDLDARVRSCAHKTGDKTLIEKFSDCDMITLGAKYHLICHLHRKAATSDIKYIDSFNPSVCKSQAFSDFGGIYWEF